MVKKQQVIVIGLGVFGTTVAQEMTRLGHDVLGLDIDEQRVDRLAQDITHAVIADVTDESALIELNAGSYDVGVVAIGRNAEATMLATLQLHELGVKNMGKSVEPAAPPDSGTAGSHPGYLARTRNGRAHFPGAELSHGARLPEPG